MRQHWPKKLETPRCKNHLKMRLLRPIKNASKMFRLVQNFLRPTFFKVQFHTPQMQSAACIRHSLSVYLHHQMTDKRILFFCNKFHLLLRELQSCDLCSQHRLSIFFLYFEEKQGVLYTSFNFELSLNKSILRKFYIYTLHRSTAQGREHNVSRV